MCISRVDSRVYFKTNETNGAAHGQMGKKSTAAMAAKQARTARRSGASRTIGGAAGTAFGIRLYGAGFHDCLSAENLDAVLRPIIGEAYLDARVLYDVRTGAEEPEYVRKEIKRLLRRHKQVLAPLHVRFHWTMAVFCAEGTGIVATVLDSAPSDVTRADIGELLGRMRVRFCILTPGRQPRGSDECGVHTIVNALRAHFQLPPLIARGHLRLAHLRAVFEGMAEKHDESEVVKTWRISLARRIAVAPRERVQLSDRLGGAGQQEPAVIAARCEEPPPVAPTCAEKPTPGEQQTRSEPESAERTVVERSRGYTHCPYKPAAVSGAGPSPPGEMVTHDNIVRHNLCYEHAALQLLRLADGRPVPDRISGLLALQRQWKHQLGRQECAIDLLWKLCQDPTPFPCAYFGLEEAIVASVLEMPRCIVLDPTVIVGRGPRFCPPLTHGVMGVVEFLGNVSAHLGATNGHYEFRDSLAACTGGPIVAFLLVRRAGAPSPDAAVVAPIRTDAPRRNVHFNLRAAAQTNPDAASAAVVVPVAQHARGTPPPYTPVLQDATALLGLARLACDNVDHRVWVRAREGPDGVPFECTGALQRGAFVRKQCVHADVGEGAAKPLHFGSGSPTVLLSFRVAHDGERVLYQSATQTERPATLKRKELLARIAAMKKGAPIFVHWSKGLLAGRWYGRVVQQTYPAIVRFESETCEMCGTVRTMDTPIEVEVPLQGTAYWDVACRPVPTGEACMCSTHDADEGSDDGRSDEGRDEDVAENAAPDMVEARERMLATLELQPNDAQWTATATELNGNTGRHWHLWSGRPPRTHHLVWRQLSQSTRSQHLRWLKVIRGLPASLAKVSLDRALVDTILRMASVRKWRWSTVSSALSAAASALAQLSVYTQEAGDINVVTPYYRQAMKRAQQRARTEVVVERDSPAMAREVYERLCGYGGHKDPAQVKASRARLLLQLCWHFAARVGDMRQVCPCDVEVQKGVTGRSATKITFRFGKGAAFWGPYTIHAMLPADVAKDIAAIVHAMPADQAIFRTRDQAALSAAVKTCGLTLRAIRRGAIVHASSCGATDDELRLLSGHKRHDTLMRYLGWGRASATAQQAAVSRAARQSGPVGAGVKAPPGPLPEQPAKMGLHTGRGGARGRRILEPPRFFPLQMPTAEELGTPAAEVDTSKWPLHVKDVPFVLWDHVQELARGTPFEGGIARARGWCEDTCFYGQQHGTPPEEIAYARFTAEQLRVLIAAGKIEPHTGPVRAACNAFAVPQHSKQRLRPIFEPRINRTFLDTETNALSYPSRLERRARARGMRFSAELDFAAYFDQFPLAEQCRSWFVVRAPCEVDGHRLLRLTRMPMGAGFAPGVAQTVTWAIAAPLLSMEDVFVDTMIDNVRIAARTPGQFLKAMRTFLARVQHSGLLLNDAAEWDLDDQALLHRCAITDTPRTFLGEQYLRDAVCNTPATLDKLRLAMRKYDEWRADPSTKYTMRNFASLVGVLLFLAHTVEISLARFFILLRAYGAMIGKTTAWDQPCAFTSDEADAQLHAFADAVLRNEPRPFPVLMPPSFRVADYGAQVLVDASSNGWGAYVHFPDTQRTYVLRQRWGTRMGRSAHAEPKAAFLAVRWARQQRPGARVALVTDHHAIASGQRRWYSRNGGFSSSWHLNNLFDELYERGGGEVFYVEGEHNLADAPSRDCSAPLTMLAQSAQIHVPPLTEFLHPHREIPRPAFHV